MNFEWSYSAVDAWNLISNLCEPELVCLTMKLFVVLESCSTLEGVACP